MRKFISQAFAAESFDGELEVIERRHVIPSRGKGPRPGGGLLHSAPGGPMSGSGLPGARGGGDERHESHRHDWQLSSTVRPTSALQFFYKGAIDRVHRFIDWVESEEGLNAAEDLTTDDGGGVPDPHRPAVADPPDLRGGGLRLRGSGVSAGSRCSTRPLPTRRAIGSTRPTGISASRGSPRWTWRRSRGSSRHALPGRRRRASDSASVRTAAAGLRAPLLGRWGRGTVRADPRPGRPLPGVATSILSSSRIRDSIASSTPATTAARSRARSPIRQARRRFASIRAHTSRGICLRAMGLAALRSPCATFSALPDRSRTAHHERQRATLDPRMSVAAPASFSSSVAPSDSIASSTPAMGLLRLARRLSTTRFTDEDLITAADVVRSSLGYPLAHVEARDHIRDHHAHFYLRVPCRHGSAPATAWQPRRCVTTIGPNDEQEARCPASADFFAVRTTVQTGATATGTFGLGLLLTSAADLPAGGPRKAQLANSSAAARELTDDDDAIAAINVWFGQAQTPEGLYLGRWASADVSTTLRGGTAPTVAAGAGALNASNASFGYDGNDYALDLSGSATYAAIATVIQTAIAANLTGATFTYDTASGRFLLTRADAAPGDAFFAPHSAGTGTDATVELGMALASDPLHLQGHDAEDPDDAWNEINGSVAGREPVLCMRDDGTPDTYGTAAADTDDALKAFAQTIKALYLTRSTTTAPIQDAYDNQQHHVGIVPHRCWRAPGRGSGGAALGGRLLECGHADQPPRQGAIERSAHGHRRHRLCGTATHPRQHLHHGRRQPFGHRRVQRTQRLLPGRIVRPDLAGERAGAGPVVGAAQLSPAHAGGAAAGAQRELHAGRVQRDPPGGLGGARRDRGGHPADDREHRVRLRGRRHAGAHPRLPGLGRAGERQDGHHGRHGLPAARRSTGPTAT